tara:strand:- start:8778 stop:10190 length:1413 start_codon:yes stop_codon:yes gene_type:complete
MATTILQAPQLPFDQAYGPNPLTLAGIPFDPITGALSADKYVLQIYRNGTLIADLRQTPNAVGRAIFDIQNTLQNYVAPSPNNVEEIGYIGNDLMNSANESVPYTFKTGFESGGQVTIDNEPTQVYLDFGGTKKYFETPYLSTPTFIPSLTSNGLCTNILKQAQPFTTMKSYRLGADITDGKPAWLTDVMRVYDHYVTLSDMTTISYYNSVNGTGPALSKSIDAFVFWQYNGNTELEMNPLYNVVGNGGGPNTLPKQGITPTYPTRAITCGTGPRNFQDLDSQTTHYYVATAPQTNSSCTSIVGGLADGSMHYVHRFNIIEEGCNDFPTYQFSWLNEYGFRDYYSFKKRKDRGVKINRNEYLKEAANYNATSYNVNIYDRGTTVFSQTLPEEFSAFTGFVSDADALYLEGLFISADVKVRFDDAPGAERYQWVPVSLLSTSYEEKTVRKNQLFQYDIKFKLAHNIKSQRG